jgi:O-methyltransferase involved in polyketide biosynthesis
MDPTTYDHPSVQRLKIEFLAEGNPKHVRDHMRTVAAKLQVASVGSS